MAALPLQQLLAAIQHQRGAAHAQSIHPRYAPDGPVDSGYNPAQYQRAMGNHEQAYRDWMAHHPGAVSRGQLPPWVRQYQAQRLGHAIPAHQAPPPMAGAGSVGENYGQAPVPTDIANPFRAPGPAPAAGPPAGPDLGNLPGRNPYNVPVTDPNRQPGYPGRDPNQPSAIVGGAPSPSPSFNPYPPIHFGGGIGVHPPFQPQPPGIHPGAIAASQALMGYA